MSAKRALPNPGPRHGGKAARRIGIGTRLWRRVRRGGRPLAAAGLVVALCAVSVVVVRSGLLDRAVEGVRSTLAGIGAASGLTLRSVTIEGRHQTTEAQVKRALAAPPGEPILSFDLAQMRARVLELPWVQDVRIERHLPDRLHVQLTERTAFALWQERGQHVVIDRDGRVVETQRIASFAHLPMVVGAGAEREAAEILDLLSLHPELASRTKAAVLVGQRRWNLRLRTGADVMLPEQGIEAALARLADLQHRHGLLDRDLATFDLRLADRLVLGPPPMPPPAPAQGPRTGGRSG